MDTEGELTATGMHEKVGALLVEVPRESILGTYGFRSDDVVLLIDRQATPNLQNFVRTMDSLKSGPHKAKVWRGQRFETFTFSQ